MNEWNLLPAFRNQIFTLKPGLLASLGKDSITLTRPSPHFRAAADGWSRTDKTRAFHLKLRDLAKGLLPFIYYPAYTGVFCFCVVDLEEKPNILAPSRLASHLASYFLHLCYLPGPCQALGVLSPGSGRHPRCLLRPSRTMLGSVRRLGYFSRREAGVSRP